MAKLILCELYKLRRRRFFLLAALSAALFPLPLAAIVRAPQFAAQYVSAQERFNDYFSYVMGDGVELLLPCVLGVAASLLFSLERDAGTLKNLRAVPVSRARLALAKLAVLLLCGCLFSLASTGAAAVCGAFLGGVNGLGRKLLLSLQMGVFVTAGTLPLIAAVALFSRSTLFSVLLCVFYSVLSLTAETGFGALPKALCWAMPIPLTTLWSAGEMIRLGIRAPIASLEALMPTTAQACAILAAMAALSAALTARFYERRAD